MNGLPLDIAKEIALLSIDSFEMIQRLFKVNKVFNQAIIHLIDQKNILAPYILESSRNEMNFGHFPQKEAIKALYQLVVSKVQALPNKYLHGLAYYHANRELKIHQFRLGYLIKYGYHIAKESVDKKRWIAKTQVTFFPKFLATYYNDNGSVVELYNEKFIIINRTKTLKSSNPEAYHKLLAEFYQRFDYLSSVIYKKGNIM